MFFLYILIFMISAPGCTVLSAGIRRHISHPAHIFKVTTPDLFPAFQEDFS